MKCSLKRLIYAVNFLFFLFTFSLDLESLIKNELRKEFGEEVRLKNYKVLTGIPDNFSKVELKVYKNSPRGFLHLKNTKVGTIALELEWKCRVLVAKRDIYPGERLNFSNVEEREIYLERCPQNFKENFVNFVALKEIKKGTIVRRSYLKKEFLVKRGEIVNAVYENGNVVIRFRTKALENGYYGEVIRVLSPFSRKVIRGKIIGEGTVKILR
ncbi:flagellar basal body P-ring formation chaperone FlgA [Aquifex aeolicus]|nr:flagellar basal body P-ring formation chaperone FlgA [Aquifex aeolicus]